METRAKLSRVKGSKLARGYRGGEEEEEAEEEEGKRSRFHLKGRKGKEEVEARGSSSFFYFSMDIKSSVQFDSRLHAIESPSRTGATSMFVPTYERISLCLSLSRPLSPCSKAPTGFMEVDEAEIPCTVQYSTRLFLRGASGYHSRAFWQIKPRGSEKRSRPCPATQTPSGSHCNNDTCYHGSDPQSMGLGFHSGRGGEGGNTVVLYGVLYNVYST